MKGESDHPGNVSVSATTRKRGEAVISRRFFLAGAASLVFTPTAEAQPGKIWRIGYLAPGMPDDVPLLEAFLEGLRALGYMEGHNIALERRTAQGRFEKLNTLAEELAHLPVDLIVAPTTP